MKAIVTVVGLDRVGIIGEICTLLASLQVNIVDISQTVMQDYFTMIMLVDMSRSDKTFDEIGTPYCITVDFQTVGDAENPADNAVTVRDRDTMEQVRVPISELKAWLDEKLAY